MKKESDRRFTIGLIIIIIGAVWLAISAFTLKSDGTVHYILSLLCIIAGLIVMHTEGKRPQTATRQRPSQLSLEADEAQSLSTDAATDSMHNTVESTLRGFPTPPEYHLGWKLKYNYTDVKVAVPNMEYFKEKMNASSLSLSMLQQMNNQYDPKAVMLVDGTEVVGYLYRGTLQDMANDWISREDLCKARVSKIDLEKEEVYLTLDFYKSIEEDLIPYKENVTLVKTTKETDSIYDDRQINLHDLVEEGEWAEIEFDDEYQSYVVTGEYTGEIGELSKKLSEQMEEDGYEYIGKVLEITSSENGRMGAKIRIFRYPDDV